MVDVKDETLTDLTCMQVKGGDAKAVDEHLADSISLNNAVILNHSGWSSVLVEACHSPSLHSSSTFSHVDRLQLHAHVLCESLSCYVALQ